MIKMLSSHILGDLLVRYVADRTETVGLLVVPASMQDQLVERRSGLAGLAFIDQLPNAGNPPASAQEPLVQLKLLGDAYPGGFAHGHTLRGSASLKRFRFEDQFVKRVEKSTRISTLLKSGDGLALRHLLTWTEGDRGLRIVSTFYNDSASSVRLEMFSSFTLGNITPFCRDDAPGRLRVHRFSSAWSAEGRRQTQSIEELHLERSWGGSGVVAERFGQVGSMPVRRWFPFVAVEDFVAGATWAAQLHWAGSWQMEVGRQHDEVCLSGGLGDREFGHWMKTVASGESFQAPMAVLTCVQGGLDEACDALTAMQESALESQPPVEWDLPIVFNEWCTTWGKPNHDSALKIADRLAGTDTRYLVLDAGWYKTEQAGAGSDHGDWVPSPLFFPEGLAATARAIRERGLIPGLWFEMETVGSQSHAFSLVDHLLARDGIPITVGVRRFWDLNDPWVIDFLSERVIGLLREGNFGYLKVDYNETLGAGSDDPDGLGEGLRKTVEGVYRLFGRIRGALPELVIENCASGGHRLEPSMLAITAMSSFSDAHELPEIPLIAANLHHLMLPRQSQIWAVLHPGDPDRRLVYSLAATFLGRMCLSGNITGLSSAEWETVQRAQRLYRQAVPILRHGTSRRFGRIGESFRHPEGWQAMRRLAADGQSMLVVIHTFARVSGEGSVPLPPGEWHVKASFTLEEPAWRIKEDAFIGSLAHDFTGSVYLLAKQSTPSLPGE